ncbi:MAG: phosphoribosylformylglycinamidine cyclo-ligase, partial [Gemmatimonadetes bacterium]|nr:phosphoribosylformylglycinamidine cyclo-ligase [Gemmatimonadota bacterium]
MLTPGKTYRESGVDLDAAAAVKEKIKAITAGTMAEGALQGFFAGVYEPGPDSDTLLVASSDSVGTKVKVAQAARRYTSIGVDMVNHSVNDILPTGAEPIFFLDYIGIGRLNERIVTELVEGMAAACLEAGCALIGGETAQLPGLYRGDDFDLVGFIVGSVRRDAFIGGRRGRPGDVLIGLPSSGLHTNGYSLVRSVFDIDGHPENLDEWVPALGAKLGDALLEPHRSYLAALRPVAGTIRGMAHITGGGIPFNLPRVLPDGVGAEIRLDSWEVPPLFRLIRERGGVDETEMFRVFNMGVGMIVVAAPDAAPGVLKRVPDAWELG